MCPCIVHRRARRWQLVLLLCLLRSETGISLHVGLGAVENATATNASTSTQLPAVTSATPADVNGSRVREFYDIDHLDWGQVRRGQGAGWGNTRGPELLM